METIMRKIITKTMSVLISLAIILLPARDAFSLPAGEVVVNGTAIFDRSEANTLKVTTSTNNVIINYDSFSIGENEYVYFYMPSSSASALNKVMGTDVSRLIGSLSATGRIFIINPNGIIIGPQANIDVASLIASTLSISNEDFLAGNYRFEDLSDEAARILNEGNITVAEGGFIALLSDSVENSGVITAERGSIALASGKKMTLSFDNDGLIQVAIDESTQEKLEGVDDAILNLGTIKADGGLVLLKADVVKDVFKNAINNEGIVQANAVIEKDGKIEIVATNAPISNKKTIIASGDVTLYADNALIDIRGDNALVSSETGSINLETTNKERINVYGTLYAPQGDVRLWTCGTLDLRGASVTSLEGGYTYNPDDEILVSWIGTSGYWYDTENWSGGAVPDSYFYDVTIDYSGATVYSSSSRTIGGLTIGTTYSSSLYLGNTLEVDDTDVNLNGDLTLNSYGTLDTGGYNVTVDGTLSISGGALTSSSGMDIDAGSINHTSGTISTTAYNYTMYLNGSGSFVLGDINADGDVYIGHSSYGSTPSSITFSDSGIDTTSYGSYSVYAYSNGDITQNADIGDSTYYFNDVKFNVDQDGSGTAALNNSSNYTTYANNVYVDGYASDGTTALTVDGLNVYSGTVYLGYNYKPSLLTIGSNGVYTGSSGSYDLYTYSNGGITQNGYIGSSDGSYYFSSAYFYVDQSGGGSAEYDGNDYTIYASSPYFYGYSSGITTLTLRDIDLNGNTLALGSSYYIGNTSIYGTSLGDITTNDTGSYSLSVYSDDDITQNADIGSGSYYFNNIYFNLDQDGTNSTPTLTGNGYNIYANGTVYVDGHSNGSTDLTVNGVDVSTATFYVGNTNQPNSIDITGAVASGTTNLYATNDITIGAAVNSGSCTTTISSSSGSIYGDNSNTITADTVTLSTGNGGDIGKSGGQNLLVNTGTLTAITGNHPNICIYNAGVGTLSVGAMTTGSATTIDSNLTFTLAGVSVSTGALTIGSTYASPTLNINGSLSSATTVDITASAISHTSGTISSTTGGDVSIDSSGTPGSFALGNITSTGGVVNIGQSTAPSSITQPQGSTITCNTLNISAVNDIGTSSNSVDTSGIDSLTYNSQAGNVYIDIASETADTVTITNIDQSASYNLTCAKTVDITSLTSDGNINITTSAGNINITDVTGGGYVNLSAPNGSVLATGSTISGSSGRVEAGGVVGTSATAINLAIDGPMTVIANGTSGLYSAYLTGRANLMTNDAPGIISMNGNLVHLPKGIGEAVSNTESTINEYEEMKDLETRPDGGKYIVNEVPAPEAPNLASEYIDTTDFVLENPYEFSTGPYLIAVPNVR